jgi:hypothetical protein
VLLRCSAVVVLLASLGAVTGCSGGSSAGSTVSPSASPTPSASYRRGEIRPGSVPDLCAAVSTRTRRTLRVDHASPPSTGGCSWTEREDHGFVRDTRELSLSYLAYAPPETRREYSATDEARYRFRRPAGWVGRRTVPVPRLGDEAKLARSLEFDQKHSSVWVAVRVRNVIVDVRAEMTSELEPGDGRLPPFAAVEAGAMAAAGEAVAALHAVASPRPSPSPTYADGEVRRVHGVCPAVDRDGARLAPGVTKRDITTADGSTAGGCTWWDNTGERPGLTVQAEAVPPGAATGESATQVAKDLYYLNRGAPMTGPGAPGDVAKARYYRSGAYGSVDLLARKGNLLVAVEYERWDHLSKAGMERDAAGVAAHVLAGYA